MEIMVVVKLILKQEGHSDKYINICCETAFTILHEIYRVKFASNSGTVFLILERLPVFHVY